MKDFLINKSDELNNNINIIEYFFTDIFINWEKELPNSKFIEYSLESIRRNYYLFQTELIGLKLIIDNAILRNNFTPLKNKDLVLFNEGRKLIHLLIDNVSLFEYITFIIKKNNTEFEKKLKEKKKDSAYYVREVLFDFKVIKDNYKDILKLIWDIRDSIHKGYIPLTDIKEDITIPQTTRKLKINLKKDENAGLSTSTMLHLNLFLSHTTLQVANYYSDINPN